MGHSRHYFTPPARGQVSEQRRGDLAPHVREGVAVEEKERSAAMALPQEVYGFVEGEDLLLLCRPLACARCLSLSIKAVLRASSCARSSVEADDKLPTPVFDKSGSGL
jgi:hypothetical protein